MHGAYRKKDAHCLQRGFERSRMGKQAFNVAQLALLASIWPDMGLERPTFVSEPSASSSGGMCVMVPYLAACTRDAAPKSRASPKSATLATGESGAASSPASSTLPPFRSAG